MPQSQIVITITDEGKFNCTGPLDNKLLCYGMLELAKEAVLRHDPNRVIHQPTDDDRKVLGKLGGAN